jgi:thiamine transport system substrate-binding protein
VLKNLTLDSLLNSNLIGKLITENPKFSSPGLGFLLWTIAVYGDPQKNINGLLGSDWRLFWNQARNKINITKSWGDAFTIFFDENENKPIMVSYGTSPAYGYCLWGDDSTSAALTYENNSPNAWLQIEGVGLVKNAPNPENGKAFINWFLSSQLQSQIPTSQWMYPANIEATVPECFNEAAINPNSVTKLNDILSPEILKDNIKYWQDEWEIVIVGQQSIDGFSFAYLIITLTPIAFITMIRRKK